MDTLQGAIDPRSMCQLKDCQTRAYHLIAWPMRLPVPMCTPHWTSIQAMPEMSPRKWFEWIKENAKV